MLNRCDHHGHCHRADIPRRSNPSYDRPLRARHTSNAGVPIQFWRKHARCSPPFQVVCTGADAGKLAIPIRVIIPSNLPCLLANASAIVGRSDAGFPITREEPVPERLGARGLSVDTGDMRVLDYPRARVCRRIFVPQPHSVPCGVEPGHGGSKVAASPRCPQLVPVAHAATNTFSTIIAATPVTAPPAPPTVLRTKPPAFGTVSVQVRVDVRQHAVHQDLLVHAHHAPRERVVPAGGSQRHMVVDCGVRREESPCSGRGTRREPTGGRTLCGIALGRLELAMDGHDVSSLGTAATVAAAAAAPATATHQGLDFVDDPGPEPDSIGLHNHGSHVLSHKLRLELQALVCELKVRCLSVGVRQQRRGTSTGTIFRPSPSTGMRTRTSPIHRCRRHCRSVGVHETNPTHNVQLLADDAGKRVYGVLRRGVRDHEQGPSQHVSKAAHVADPRLCDLRVASVEHHEKQNTTV